MTLTAFCKKIKKVVLDFLFGEASELKYNPKKGYYDYHRPYRFIPRLRAKPQNKIKSVTKKNND